MRNDVESQEARVDLLVLFQQEIIQQVWKNRP